MKSFNLLVVSVLIIYCACVFALLSREANDLISLSKWKEMSYDVLSKYDQEREAVLKYEQKLRKDSIPGLWG